MISVRKNPNFTQFFQVFSFGRFIEEIQGQQKALRIAKQEAKKHNLPSVNFLGNSIDSNK